MSETSPSPLVGVIMGSGSDLETMTPARELLTELGVPHEVRVVSAHRTPDWMFEYAETAEARGLEVIIAAAGGAAHLPGMVAAKTVLPVLGVPVPETMRSVRSRPAKSTARICTCQSGDTRGMTIVTCAPFGVSVSPCIVICQRGSPGNADTVPLCACGS